MKPVPDLLVGFHDAQNYRRRENREFFNQLFLRTPELDKLLDPNIYFLIGEKGTGKTAYAIYLSSVGYKNVIASTKYIQETDYLKFVAMKHEKHLSLSDYVSIWKVIIYVLLAQQIREKEPSLIAKGLSNFPALGEAIDEFYKYAFSPEIHSSIQFAEEAGLAAKLIAKFIELGGNTKSTTIFTESTYQVNLLYIQRKFEDAFRSIKISKDQILFIDGIDIRPTTVDVDEYLDCIKGLANAVWSVNNDTFANVKDTKGQARVVLLMRPDIFNYLNLQNMNSKVRDNAVILNWITNYADYRTSPLFLMADRLLSFQQETAHPKGNVWDYYFPYDAKNVKAQLQSPSSFIMFLRYCLYRPRNVLAILSIQKELFMEQGRDSSDVFRLEDFSDPIFTRKYSDYVLGEVKDHISFYNDPGDYESLLRFFQYLEGKSMFSYKYYLDAFSKYIKFLRKNSFQIPKFCDTPDILLQFLYDLNILGYIVETKDPRHPFFSWVNRDRSSSNIAPKVRTNVNYEIHFGLMKALDLGMWFEIKDDSEWDSSILE